MSATPDPFDPLDPLDPDPALPPSAFTGDGRDSGGGATLPAPEARSPAASDPAGAGASSPFDAPEGGTATDEAAPDPGAGDAPAPEPPPGLASAVESLIAGMRAPAAEAPAGAEDSPHASGPGASDAPSASDEEDGGEAPAFDPSDSPALDAVAAAGAESSADAPAPRPSRREGMGAILYETGVAFRVWAPNAVSVSVAGTFNGWSADASPLAREDDGCWSGDVEGAGVGAEYRFLVRTADGRELRRSDPYARDLESSVGDSIVTDPAFDWGDPSGYRSPDWRELVIYELHVGTFNDRPGGAPGTFQGVIDRLDYLADLGVSCIELMPSAEFASDWSWGYNPAFLFAIESAFGGPVELKRLVKEAHARGIAIVLDVVYNHLGPSDLDLWQFDGWSPAPDKGGIWFYNDHRSRTPWGDTRPDYGRVEVRRYLAENARSWLEEFRMDGLRWDATAYIRNVHGNNDDPAGDIPDGWGVMQHITADTDRRQPWKLHIAEDLRGNVWITRPSRQGGAGFDTQWDGEFVHPVRRAILAAHDADRRMHEVAAAVAHRYNGDPLQRVVYTESHDEVANGRARVPHEIDPEDPGSWAARKRSTLGAALVFTTPGIPMLFQGQEILEDEWFRDTDPVDWSKLERFSGIHRMYRDLTRLRRDWFDHTRGLRGPHVDVYHVNDADKVIAFHRRESGGARDDVVVVANFGNRAYPEYLVGFPRAGEWRVRFNGDARVYGDDFGAQDSFDLTAGGAPMHGMPVSGSVGIGPYTVVILSQDE